MSNVIELIDRIRIESKGVGIDLNSFTKLASSDSNAIRDKTPKTAHNQSMSEPLSRPELQAELNAIRSEMRASQAEIRADIMSMQKAVTESISQVSVNVASMRGDFGEKIGDVNSKIGNISGEIKGINGHIDGLKASIGMLQWIIGIVGLVAGLWIAYQQLSVATQPPQAEALQPVATSQPKPPKQVR